jgi:hypothetical protein
MSTRKIDDGAIALTHGVLFEAEVPRCDACGALLDAAEDDDAGGRYGVRGRGLYVWTRGSEVRYEEPPLCASCAAAVGLSALARWEIEEEEG